VIFLRNRVYVTDEYQIREESARKRLAVNPVPTEKKRDARDEWQSQDNERCSTLTLTWLSKILTYNASVNNNI